MINELDNLITESINNRTNNIDEKSLSEVLKIINEEDKKVAYAVEKELPNIEKAVEKIIESFKKGGRLFYIGAGTSGRLGTLDAAECPPTFGTPYEQVVGIIAGGRDALICAIEGAEDSMELGEKDLSERELTSDDVVVGIAASGRTPYVIGALKYAKKVGAITVSLSCNEKPLIGEYADISITPIVGPEIITGSTRMKAGTAQKMVLNMLSTASMIGIGKVYGNLMVDVQPTNEKLIQRAKRMVMLATGADKEKVEKTLELSGFNPKIAIVMLKKNCTYEEATKRLKDGDGFIHRALK
ncbi:N-acetylmuramic acid-6-phosphate etherase [Proteiniborus sp. DW1]|uniref:N-acetylmuramic acid 6-phosphate etherase n=1 Tax=Proteiniborus sp. DW1 TaxID=1889883 RepID=UPI00092E0C30|nr:N-acetylmuramic acid 6-phosphate etherase [Proteiniborus sp. DW1]SCG82386.1 N-acetylmuramic acid-6-phosphate etherase [Proteiniborus sp. DW1]